MQDLEPVTRETEPVPEPLRREVNLLGSVLGRVLTEAEGPELFDDVERLRKATIALRQDPGQARAAAIVALVVSMDLSRAELVARAFTVYFQLVNLAEEHQRVRTLRERGRDRDLVDESLAAAVAHVRGTQGQGCLDDLLARLEVSPVLTAHPTEARRRAVVETLHRVASQTERLDDPRLSASELADLQRRLHEEVAILWRTAQLRSRPPTPLDEVRRVLAVFDETLFRVVPAVYRELDRALSPADVGARPPAFRPFLRWGSWVGGDRDGNPHVTSDVTRATLEIQAEHVLRGLEAVTRRIGRSLSASADATPPSLALAQSLATDERDFPQVGAALRARAPEEPHQRKLSLVAERVAATRAGDPRGYPRPQAMAADLGLVQESLAAAGAQRLAYGELQHLQWQLQTFGFHLASLEVRQHSSVHRAVLEEALPGSSDDVRALERLAAHGWPPQAATSSEQAFELQATLRTMRDLQQRYGAQACRRYVVSFTRTPADIVAVRALARLAVPDGSLDVDVVPLFETREDLAHATSVLDGLLNLPGERARLDGGGRRMEVMLGYSDSAKDAGFLAANLALYEVQRELAAWARRHRVALTIFHGRGGGLGRGGGPANRAVRGQAPGSVAGRFKVTEQGEVIPARYRSMALAQRHLEQVSSAVLVASTPAAEARPAHAADGDAELVDTMARASEAAYRDLVERPGFPAFFARVTPHRELTALRIGSRPSKRTPSGGLDELRAIPWVFAWSQSRVNLTGWYGLGAGLEAAAERGGMAALRAMYDDWPFFTSLMENAEMSLAKADPLIGGLYLRLGDRPDLTAAVEDEFARTRRMVLAVTRHDRLLGNRPVLRRAVHLRNPYVDALSFLQLRALAELRSGIEDPDRAHRVEALVLLTINGVSAGLQNTG